jgi:hypothetical protein
LVSFTPRLLYPWEKRHRFPLDPRPGCSQVQSRRGDEGESPISAGIPTLVVWPIASHLTVSVTCCLFRYYESRDSLVGIGNDYGLEIGVRFPAGDGNFSLQHHVQTGSGAHPASYPIGGRSYFPGVRRARREADNSPPSSAEVKNAWRYTSTPPICLHCVVLVKHKDNFTFYINYYSVIMRRFIQRV